MHGNDWEDGYLSVNMFWHFHGFVVTWIESNLHHLTVWVKWEPTASATAPPPPTPKRSRIFGVSSGPGSGAAANGFDAGAFSLEFGCVMVESKIFCISIILPQKQTISAVMTEPELLHGGFLLCEKLLSCALVDVGTVGRGAECAARIKGHEQTFAIKKENWRKEKK